MANKRNVAMLIVGLLVSGGDYAQGNNMEDVEQGRAGSGSGATAPEVGTNGPPSTRIEKRSIPHHQAKGSSGSAKTQKPQLKPDYPCQNLHVKPMNCPTR
jgi:hypothetical protein